MIDSNKTFGKDIPESERNQLLSRIDELENLLARKKAESQQANAPRLKVGTDGIPVLEDLFSGEEPDAAQSALDNDDELINEIIDKVDKEITQDLDELIVLLKDSIIDEVKTRLIKELHINSKNK